MVAKSADPPDPGVVLATFDAAEWDEAAAKATHTRCEQCHTMDPLFSHPVNVTPSSRVASNSFPLDQGRLVCVTCHSERATQTHAKGSGSMLRSGFQGTSFCQQCHTTVGHDARSAHAAGLGRAHLEVGRGRSDSISQFGESSLDDESTRCVTCHDGTFGGDAGNHSVRNRAGKPEPRSDHPIGVGYRARRDLGSDLRLVDASRLDRRVRLFGRTVGCGSCHSPYAGTQDQLVVSNQRSQLCLTCHIQ